MNSLDPGPFKYGHWKFPYRPFYVGKGKGHRYKKHEEFARIGHEHYNKHKFNKIRKILRSRGTIEVRFVRVHVSDADALLLEARLIASIGRADLKLGPLTNLTDGGDGVSGNKWSRSTRKKHADRIRSRNLDDKSILSAKIRAGIACSADEKARRVQKWRESMANRSQEDIEASRRRSRRSLRNTLATADPKRKTEDYEARAAKAKSKSPAEKAAIRAKKQQSWAQRTVDQNKLKEQRRQRTLQGV